MLEVVDVVVVGFKRWRLVEIGGDEVGVCVCWGVMEGGV